MPIPAGVDEVYEELKTEVTWLHGRWNIYRQLYGTSEKRVDLLNEVASGFFYILQDVLIGDVQVTLSKLTDSARNVRGDHENLSFELLQERLDATEHSKLATDNRSILNLLKESCKPFRKWRNKRLAHLDLATSLKVASEPLPGVSRQLVEDSLTLVRNYMNAVEVYFNDAEHGYERFIMRGDGDALVALLRCGLRYEELVQSREISIDDLRRSCWHDP